jgi:hypothetical protein
MLKEENRNKVQGLSYGIFMGIVVLHCGMGCAFVFRIFTRGDLDVVLQNETMV